MRRTVFLDSRPEMLRARSDVDVIETFHFREGLNAAIVEIEDDTILEHISEVQGIEPVDEEFAVRVATSQRDSIATIDDVRKLHKIPRNGNTGKGITVVVMDSGIDENHPIFEGMDITHVDVTGRGEQDEVGHGTAVAGQIARLAPEVDLISLRIFGDSGRSTMRTILRAYEWLLTNTGKYDIVNMSWGAARRVKQLDQIQNTLVEQGVRDVTAAGNTGDKGGSPATAEKAFAVGACDENGEMASFSSYNPNRTNPEVTAIGENNRLAQAEGTSMGRDVEGRYVVASGTSFAAPETAGAVAKFFESHRSKEADSIFQKYADDVPNTPRDGAGLLKYQPAFESVPPGESIPETSATVWSPLNMNADMMYMGEDWLSDGSYTARLIEENRVEFRKD